MMSPKKVYLIGFMGAGKSTIAPVLAERLGWDWVDTDRRIKERAGMSIPEIFEYYGENRFREMEGEVIAEVSREEQGVVAVGGGAPMDDRNWSRMKDTGETVYLEVSPKTIFERISPDGSRPLLVGLNEEEKINKINRMLRDRHPSYARADYRIDCDGAGPGAIAEEIVRELGNHEES